ncbi:MAG: hypothetical protein JSW70_03365 [Syntrophobacterales bacterium]|nr:MAG: hypothetical protein JSW70_03365 [Syntrophobacterales bacterium]
MEGLKTVAELMAVSARTAPKSAGQDFVEIKILDGEEIQDLAEGMVTFGRERGKGNFDRDGKNVGQSEVVVLIGLKGDKALGLNCGGCGYATCKELEEAQRFDGEFSGPHCAYRLLDMGIALGSAVKTAGLLNADNRIMYRIGAVARSMGYCDWDYVMGIPLSATGKNIYFDR